MLLIWLKHGDTALHAGFSVYCDIVGIKKLTKLKISEAKSSTIQNNSITLLSVIIAIIVCKSL